MSHTSLDITIHKMSKRIYLYKKQQLNTGAPKVPQCLYQPLILTSLVYLTKRGCVQLSSLEFHH